ncbi:hypothetical protein [Calothrix sp. PCC 6303]|uniref:hypothetical protein n=1 Tax=Calothrix sp. PCC 6303 TaxID=1170562 RepID=UPI0002A05820|nr:hypothetical protein [Calothrix sp. PCC 6303]AFY99526.1 hypothetical protein Cal6303_0449 [Calothrix sp. PCC 6303]
MFEKLFLAIAITFSLNLCLHVREPSTVNADMNEKQKIDLLPATVVKIFQN